MSLSLKSRGCEAVSYTTEGRYWKWAHLSRPRLLGGSQPKPPGMAAEQPQSSGQTGMAGNPAELDNTSPTRGRTF